jgi:hypothetical protein
MDDRTLGTSQPMEQEIGMKQIAVNLIEGVELREEDHGN